MSNVLLSISLSVRLCIATLYLRGQIPLPICRKCLQRLLTSSQRYLKHPALYRLLCLYNRDAPLASSQAQIAPLGISKVSFILCIQQSKIDAIRCVKKYLGIFCTFVLYFSFSKPYPLLYSETRATPHSPRLRKAFYVLLHCSTLLKLHSPSTASISVGR